MQYLVIWMFIAQVCSAPGTGYEAPPYFYMQAHDTLQEAVAAEKELQALESEVQSFIVKGESGFLY